MPQVGSDAPKKAAAAKKDLVKAIKAAGENKEMMFAALEVYSGKIMSFLHGQSLSEGAVLPSKL